MPVYEIPVYQIIRKWAEDHLESGQQFTKRQLVDWFAENYPKVRRKTVTTHLRAMSTNSPSRVHYSTVRPGSGRDLFFMTDVSTYRLFDPESDPEPIYRENLPDEEEINGDIEEGDFDEASVETASAEFAYEAHLRDYLIRNLEVIEQGLRPFTENLKQSVEVDAGGRRIDILAQDRTGALVVIELKVSKGYDRVIGQLLRYMGWVRQHLADGRSVRGIIVASEISRDLILATSELSGVDLFEYQISFAVNPVK